MYAVHTLHTACGFEQQQQPNPFPVADNIQSPVDWCLPLSRGSVVAGKEVYPMQIAHSPTCTRRILPLVDLEVFTGYQELLMTQMTISQVL